MKTPVYLALKRNSETAKATKIFQSVLFCRAHSPRDRRICNQSEE